MGPKYRKGLTQKQKDIFAVHGFNQALIDQVTRRRTRSFDGLQMILGNL